MNQMTLFIVGLLNGHRQRGEGWGCIIVNSAIYNFFFFFFLILFPPTHCFCDKRIKGETLFLPFPISAVLSKSPGGNLVGMKVRNQGAVDEMQGLILQLLTSFLPKILSHGVTLVPTGLSVPSRGNTTNLLSPPLDGSHFAPG